MKSIIFFGVAIAVVIFALQYSGKRQQEMKEQAAQCDQYCQKQGAQGSEFKASGFGDGTCRCL